jgi:hypothetical protein
MPLSADERMSFILFCPKCRLGKKSSLRGSSRMNGCHALRQNAAPLLSYKLGLIAP